MKTSSERWGGGGWWAGAFLLGGRWMVVGQGAQSTQSTNLFLQSSELGLPHSLNRRRVCPPPLYSRGMGHTRLRERGWGGSQFQRGNTHCGTWWSRELKGRISRTETCAAKDKGYWRELIFQGLFWNLKGSNLQAGAFGGRGVIPERASRRESWWRRPATAPRWRCGRCGWPWSRSPVWSAPPTRPPPPRRTGCTRAAQTPAQTPEAGVLVRKLGQLTPLI